MGAFSIWHWLVVLLVLLVLLIPPVVVVGYARSKLPRSGFTLRLIGSILVLAVAGAFMEDAPPAAIAVIAIPAIVANLLIYRWTALRLNDVGWNRWLALLWFLSPAGLILSLVLCFKRSATEDGTLVFE